MGFTCTAFSARPWAEAKAAAAMLACAMANGDWRVPIRKGLSLLGTNLLVITLVHSGAPAYGKA